MKPIYFATALFFTLAACNKAPSDVVPENPDLGNAAPAATPGQSTADAGQGSANDIMTITPVKTDNCTPRSYTVQVSWAIPAGQVPNAGVQVRVNKPDGGLLAFKKGARSSATSGNWVKPGTTFYLVDAQSKAVVAQATSDGFNCQ